MEESSVVSSIQILEKDDEDAIYDRGELDEHMFVNEEYSLFWLRKKLWRLWHYVSSEGKTYPTFSSTMYIFHNLINPT